MHFFVCSSHVFYVDYVDYVQWYNTKDAWLLKSSNRALCARLAADFQQQQAALKRESIASLYYLPRAVRKKLEEAGQADTKAPRTSDVAPQDTNIARVKSLIDAADAQHVLGQLKFEMQWHKRFAFPFFVSGSLLSIADSAMPNCSQMRCNVPKE